MVKVVGNGHGNPSSNLVVAAWVSSTVNTFGKGMTSTILH